ncbi:hypothetical protein XH87_00050 [Bradyrhizobium sp. CCBAU 53415]|nr:hypothetical protein [Bradyrhizobium sp. CCBAU 53415]
MEGASATAADITLPVMAAGIWADPAHHTVAGLMSIRELATVTALIDNERSGRTRSAAIRWSLLRAGNNGSRPFGYEAVSVPKGLFNCAVLLWGVIGLLFDAGSLFGRAGSAGIGTSVYVTAILIWIGGRVLFGLGALLSHNDFDGERAPARRRRRYSDNALELSRVRAGLKCSPECPNA